MVKYAKFTQKPTIKEHFEWKWQMNDLFYRLPYSAKGKYFCWWYEIPNKQSIDLISAPNARLAASEWKNANTIWQYRKILLQSCNKSNKKISNTFRVP